jgi:hypothetical protein
MNHYSSNQVTAPIRGMPRWREAQHHLPIAEKIELIGRFIRETRRFEAVKKSCRKSVKSSSVS